MERYEKHLAGALFIVVLLGLAVLPASSDVQPIYVREAGVLKGTIVPYSTTLSASAFYNYSNSEFNGPWPSVTKNRSHLFLVDASDGLSLFVVHNAPTGTGGSNGSANMRFDLSGGDVADILVWDDTGESYFDGDTYFTSQQAWNYNYTDGLVIGSLDGNWSMDAKFTSTPTGLNNGWYAYSASSDPIQLSLTKTVELTPVPVPGAAVLGMIGISMVGAYSRKRRLAHVTQ